MTSLETGENNNNFILGPDLGSIKRKTVQTPPPLVVQYCATVLDSIIQIHHHVSIVVDAMYVNYLTFMVTVSNILKYTTSIYLKSWRKTQLVLVLTKFIQLYSKYGFVVHFINGDKKFDTLRDDFHRVYFNITASDEHVSEAELNIIVVKERTCSVQHTLPFSKIPEKIITRVVNFSMFWINNFPVSSDVGGNFIPTTIITCCTIDFVVNFKL